MECVVIFNFFLFLHENSNNKLAYESHNYIDTINAYFYHSGE